MPGLLSVENVLLLFFKFVKLIYKKALTYSTVHGTIKGKLGGEEMEQERTMFYHIASILALLVSLSSINRDRLNNKKTRLEIDDLERKAKAKRKK